jgi:hypothetical protein
MSGILTSTQASGSAVTGHLCPKTDVVASKWIAIATITAVLGHTSPNEPSWRHKMLESADLARLPSDRSRKWEIPATMRKIALIFIFMARWLARKKESIHYV